MRYAEDFRKIARNALAGNWTIAAITGFGAFLFGGGIVTKEFDILNPSDDSLITFIQNFQTKDLGMQLQSFLTTAVIIGLLWGIVRFIVGGAIRLGYAVFNLKLIDNKEVAFSNLLSQLHRFKEGFCMNFLMSIYEFLWSLLLLIPGAIKSFSYAMTPYILAENLEMTADEAITKSRYIMDGNKWRLFCLKFSFIGWHLLCMIPTYVALIVMFMVNGEAIPSLFSIMLCNIPYLIGLQFLNPYQEAAYAAFYRDIVSVSECVWVQNDEEKSARTNQ